MLLKSIQKKADRLGLKVESTKNSHVIYSKDRLRVLEYRNNTGSEYVSAILCRQTDDLTDIQTDYFAGFFHQTIKSAFTSLENKL